MSILAGTAEAMLYLFNTPRAEFDIGQLFTKFTVGFSVSLAQRLIVGKFFYRAYDKFTLQYLADKYNVDGNLIEIDHKEFLILFKGFFLDPRLVGAWEALFTFPSLRKKLHALNITANYSTRFPGKTTEIVEFLSNATTVNWPPPGSPFTYRVEQALDDIVSIDLHNQFPGLELEELVAIHHNTRGVYFPFNQALRGEIPMTSFFEIFRDLINKGLAKLDPFVGVSYRGTSIPEALLIDKYRNANLTGLPIAEHDFTSSSKVTDYLGLYMNRTVKSGEVRVVFIIDGKNGRYIDPISKFGENFQTDPTKMHREVIHSNGTQFYVREFEAKTSPEGNLYYEMRLEEL